MSQTITAEEQVILLKARLFDIQEQAANLNAQATDLGNALQTLIAVAGITGNENGQVTIKEAVEKLTAIIESSLPVEGAQVDEAE